MSKADNPYVLVVDDNSETCTLLTAILRRDFICEVAMDGMEAIEKLGTRTYGAVLLDLRMPQYDGFAVLDFIRDTRPEMASRVIIVTAALSERELARARSHNVCRIIPKPFDVDMLLAAVKQCVDPDARRHGGGGVFCAPVIMLLAELLHKKLM